MKKPRRRRTSRVFAQLFGEYAPAMRRQLDAVDAEASNLAIAFAYEKIWSRGKLSVRDRSIATVASLITMGRPTQLRWHLHGLLAQGFDWHEMRELCLHMLPYCGFPAVLEALRVVGDLERDMSKDGVRTTRGSRSRTSSREK